MYQMIGQKYGISLMIVLVLLSMVGASLAAERPILYERSGQRDPMVPLIDAEGVIFKRARVTDFMIEGIIYDPQGGSVVLIDGNVYRAGDHFNGSNIIQILKDRIILAGEEEEKTVWLREEIVEEGKRLS